MGVKDGNRFSYFPFTLLFTQNISKMKRLLSSLVLILVMGLGVQAQNNLLVISGQVTDSLSGTGIPFFPLFITVSNASPGFSYNNYIFTDGQGNYTDSIVVPGFPIDSVLIANHSCTGNGLVRVQEFLNVTGNINHNITLCTGSSTGPACSALFFTNPSPVNPNEIRFWPVNGNYQSYQWDFGDGNTSTQANPGHIYSNPGTYQACLIISDTSCADTFCQTVVVGGSPQPCDASFFMLSTGLNVQFAHVGPPANSYSWDFGDGNSSTSGNPAHTYSQAGNYNVCLIVDDGAGCRDTSCQNISVQATPSHCTAQFFYLPQPNNPLDINFIPFDTTATSFAWDFGDGTTSSQPFPNHQYAQADTYQVCLIVGNPSCSDTVCMPVIVGGGGSTPCSADYLFFSNGLTVDFLALSPAVSYEWDLGDGTVVSGPFTNYNHTYAASGTYNTCLIVDGGQGCRDTVCKPVTVTGGGGNPGCDAFFFPLPDTSSNPNPLTQLFIALDTSASSYFWDFGDGNNAYVPFTQHTYAAAGTYNVCLFVSTATCTDSFCTSVQVGPPPAICDAFYGWQAMGNNQVDFVAYHPAVSYAWDFGDGNTGTGQQPSHTYATAGTYNACLIVDDGMGCQDTLCQMVSTTQVPPPPGGAVFGQVFNGNFPATDFTAYLIEFDSVAGTLTAVDTMVSVNQQGFFFLQAPTGDYLVKAALNATDPDYTSYLPTYYGDEMMWNNATMVNANMFPFVLINMIPGNNTGGPGFIGGLVLQGANKRGEGDPMEGMHVLLLDGNGDPVTHESTHTDGSFEFKNLAYGTYQVVVEMWGRTHDPYTVVIDAANPQASGIEFEVNDHEVVALGTTSIAPRDLGVEGMRVYPNPSQGNMTLSYQLNKNAEVVTEVHDLMGKRMFYANNQQASGQQEVKLQLEGLSPGMYLLQLSIDGVKLPAKKLVVE
jgi:PKD repeat protein